MPDRSLRLPPLLLRERHPSSVPPQEGEGALRNEDGLTDGGSTPGGPGGDSASSGRSPEQSADDNPFAPPPEGTPDRPWQPRQPAPGQGQEGSEDGHSAWGSQWSDRQPGPAAGGHFGERPGAQGGPEGSAGPGKGLRWDPTDPAQRRARYALLGGMWAFFFSLFGWPSVALLLGALALYWSVSALRAGTRAPDPENPAPPSRPQTTAAISGLVTASLALMMVATMFTAQLVYRDYYTCVDDALTNAAKQSCSTLLPKELQGMLGAQD